MPKRKNILITFIGGIGAGKTTATELLAKELGFKLVREQYGKNEFLPLFYKDMKRWALHNQLFFLSEKIIQMAEIKSVLKKTSVVLDVDIAQDFCYVEAQKDTGNISDSEYGLYKKIYKTVVPLLPKADLMIYLKSSPEVLKRRINRRGFSYERRVPIPYLRALVRAQDRWFVKNKKLLPIVTVNVEKLNFADNDRDKKKFVNLVTEEIKKASR